MNLDMWEILRGYLSENEITHELLTHEPINTTAEACEVVGHAPHESTKSLVLATDTVPVVATVPADEEINFDRVKSVTGLRNIELFPPDRLQSKYGVDPGGVPPVGYNSDTAVVVEASLFENDDVYFSPGRKDKTVHVSGEVFRRIVSDWNGQVMT